MKKLFKRVVSAVLSLAIIITCLPLATTDVEAATNGVQERINQLLNVYPNGSYFTQNGQSCVDSGFFNQHVYITGEWCPNCYLPNIPARGGYPAGSAVGWSADTCAGFAGYVYYNIFGHNHLTQTTVYSNASSASTGDLVYTGTHWFVYLWQDDSYYYGYDANSHSRGQTSDGVWICDQMVQFNRAFPKSSYPLKTVYHANNYGQVSGSTNIEYTPITPATYFIVSKSDGKALTLGNNEDYNTNNIHMYETMWTNRGQYMVITEAPDGYKIRPIDSTRLVNPYGDYAASGQNINIYADVNDNSQWWKFQKVDGGYVIRNTQNPNLVIDNSQSDNAVLWEYNGEANQVWELIPVIAPGKPVITNVKSSYETSESVVVKWDSTSDTNQYNISVEKKTTNGEYKEIYWKDNVSSGYTLNSVMTLDPGDYRVRVASVNNKVLNGDYYLSTIGDYVNFTVKEKTTTGTSGTIRIDNTTAAVGQTVQIPIYIDDTKVMGVSIDVKFSPSVLKYKSYSDKAFDLVEENTDNASSGLLSFVCANTSDLTGGKIIVLTFEVVADKSCSTTISVSSSDATDGDNPVALKASEATVTISSSLLGDVTGDGKITTQDAIWVLQSVAKKRTLTAAQTSAADVTKDGKISTQDAIWILQSIVGKRVL